MTQNQQKRLPKAETRLTEALLHAIENELSRIIFKATSEARCLVCVGFFRQNVTSLCISKSFGCFSPSLFLRDNSKF